MAPDLAAIGRVSLWGRVVETQRGYRGQYGYVYDIILVSGGEAEARDLRARYAVDVSVATVPDGLSRLSQAA
jgi:hypothetical protein